MDNTELKNLIIQGNETITALRAEVDAMKGKTDAISADKIARMESDLAATLSAKQAAELAMNAIERRLAEVEVKAGRPGALGNPVHVDEHKAAFVAFVRDPQNPESQAALRAAESKATGVARTPISAGGFAVPTELSREIIKLAQDMSPIRGLARVISVGTESFSQPADLGGFGFEWVGEADTRNQTNTPDMGLIEPAFGSVVAKPEATREALADIFFNVQSWLVSSASEKFAQAEGLAFVSGNGVKKPKGFLNGTPTAEADGVRAFGTLRYVASGVADNLGAAPLDTLMGVVFDLKGAYRANANWVLNSITAAKLATLKDDQGRFLLSSPVEGAAQRILGYPVTIAEDMPNVGADAFPIAFGDFNAGYLIADREGMWIVRDEVTKPGFVRWQLGRRLGGCVADSQAIRLLKVAVS